jgi:hypothetical protein
MRLSDESDKRGSERLAKGLTLSVFPLCTTPGRLGATEDLDRLP